MIIICSLDNIQHVEADEVWIVMRSIRNLPPGILHDPKTRICQELSPSLKLLNWTLQQKKMFAFTQEVFDKKYVPQFLEEMRTIEAKNVLNQLYVENKTKRIALVCSCKTERICHRSILAGLFIGAGCEVTNEFGQDLKKYEKYWEEYQRRELI